jgi:hypothetical protein
VVWSYLQYEFASHVDVGQEAIDWQVPLLSGFLTHTEPLTQGTPPRPVHEAPTPGSFVHVPVVVPDRAQTRSPTQPRTGLMFKLHVAPSWPCTMLLSASHLNVVILQKDPGSHSPPALPQELPTLAMTEHFPHCCDPPSQNPLEHWLP